MKKLPIYILLALIGAFSVFSCVQPLDPNVKQGSGAYNLDLSVSCLAPATKAYENYPTGETDLNENKIDHIDWFIFRDTTAGNDQPWQSGRETFTGKTDGTSEFSVKTLDMQDYMGEQTSASGYVFTVANYPGQHSELSGTFHNILKVSYLTAELKSKLGINDRTKKFEELSNFVMTSTVESFTLNENAPSATVNAKLSRQMAKISLNIHIAPYIDEMLAYTSGLDTNSVSYIQTWYPDVKNIRAYLTYANMEGTLTPVTTQTDRESVAVYDEEKFFTYNSYGFKPEITYRNNDTKDTAYVVGTPFYSYPMRWETSDEHAPFIKIILAWKPVDESKIAGHVTRNVEHNFVNHTTGGVHPGTMDKVTVHSFPSATEVATGNQKFYYKITLPGENNFLRSNVWTKISLDVALLGGKEEETSVEVAGRYYVVNWSDPGVTAGGDLTAGTYLSLATARDTFYIYGGNSIEIPVLSSHNLEVVNTTATYYDYSSANPAQRTLSGDNYTIQANGRSSVTLTHELISDLNQVSAQDISTITYTFRIRHIGSSGLYKDLTVIQYPSLYIETLTPGNAFLDGRGQGSSGETYGYLSYDNKTTTIYHIHVSAFNGDSKYYTPKRQNTPDKQYEYLITDPRVNAGWGNGDILPYRPRPDETATTAWPDNTVQNMMKASSNPNFIAPSFIISSRYGRPGNSSADMTFEKAEKRCATYQEAGYPAGRWRLPTEAEVYFVHTLQDKGLIADTFTSGGYGYWASSGYAFGSSDYSEGFCTRDYNSSVRCVYDTWYWGDKPVTPIDVYHPGPTN